MDLFTGIILGVLVLFIVLRMMPAKGVKNIRANELNNKMNQEKVTVIDVREPNEYKSGHIPNAVNVPLSKLKNQMNKVPKDKPVHLICRSGGRSMQAARVLKQNGYDNLINVQGGMTAWNGKVTKR
ncbi:rhodanese-like domain-containing protein [Pseudalkalibacillus caeni]|uniref:Rhodanese-like domain-containing protein n=1 Tax=Exobacillus caeni TaxID=2574798 RepID=A0A5R9F4V5_9BACL|nr:rhodanese-like domain-containing protein [Pseudalkalibacillus caeni]TLS38752.1 rhodanese-like domain-containing protein [Pseudalkalibacillus caeni]